MRWMRGDYRDVPLIATVGNSYYFKPSVYYLVEDNVIWVIIVRIKPTGETPFWRVTYVKDGEYKTKEFRYLREAKRFGEKVLKNKLKGRW